MNNRPIKFRIWDKLLRKMMPDIFTVSFNDNSHEFMQYTGINDRNGKEIYEGDIVIYHGEYGSWKPKEIYWGHNATEWAGFVLKGTDMFLLKYDSERFEIIGNVFETPDLIKKV